MPRKPHSDGGLDREAFDKARGLFTKRAGLMPDTAVHALAAEVITRLERKGTTVAEYAGRDNGGRFFPPARLAD